MQPPQQTAKSLLLTGNDQWQWIEEELHPLRSHEILVRTIASAISIGSELPYYQGNTRTYEPVRYPYMTGYENVGIVVACGRNVQTPKKGQRVIAFYGHRTHAIVPVEKTILIPDDISDPLALLTILSCDVAKGIRKLHPMPEEAVLITGAGAIGLLTLFMLQAYGCTTVDIVEPREERRMLARILGARKGVSLQDGDKPTAIYSTAFECSSRDAAFHLIQHHMQPHGRVCIIADGNIEHLTLTPAFHAKELQIVGSSDGWNYQQHAAWYFDYVRNHRTALEQLFDLHISSAALLNTFRRLVQNEISPIKVFVDYTI